MAKPDRPGGKPGGKPTKPGKPGGRPGGKPVKKNPANPASEGMILSGSPETTIDVPAGRGFHLVGGPKAGGFVPPDALRVEVADGRATVRRGPELDVGSEVRFRFRMPPAKVAKPQTEGAKPEAEGATAAAG